MVKEAARGYEASSRAPLLSWGDAGTKSRADRSKGDSKKEARLPSPEPSFVLGQARHTALSSRPARILTALTRSPPEARVPGRLTTGGRSRRAAFSSLVPVKSLGINCKTATTTEPFRQRPLGSSSAASCAVTSARGVAATRMRVGARRPGVSSTRASWESRWPRCAGLRRLHVLPAAG